MQKDISELEQKIDETRIKNTAYKSYFENEQFVLDGKEKFSVIDFWRYQYSNIAALGGELAEFFVAKALGISKAENADYWTAYDMSYRQKRIEVKSTQYVHAWNRTRVSEQRSFSIEPTRNAYWAYQKENKKEYERQNDLYVFCLNQNKDISNNNPLCLDDWIFYIVPTFKINDYAGERQKTISLNVVKRLSQSAVNFDNIKESVDQVIDEINLTRE